MKNSHNISEETDEAEETCPVGVKVSTFGFQPKDRISIILRGTFKTDKQNIA